MTVLTPAQRRYLETLRDTGQAPRNGGRGSHTAATGRRLLADGLLELRGRTIVLSDAGRAALDEARP